MTVERRGARTCRISISKRKLRENFQLNNLSCFVFEKKVLEERYDNNNILLLTRYKFLRIRSGVKARLDPAAIKPNLYVPFNEARRMLERYVL